MASLPLLCQQMWRCNSLGSRPKLPKSLPLKKLSLKRKAQSGTEWRY